mmetsp:Transcript_50906/g.119684  ORF Transcript_50906/g.119684 Transcript_50906/m.119684 type:complete len:245 (-) Transcript_50906:69-803(-)
MSIEPLTSMQNSTLFEGALLSKRRYGGGASARKPRVATSSSSTLSNFRRSRRVVISERVTPCSAALRSTRRAAGLMLGRAWSAMRALQCASRNSWLNSPQTRPLKQSTAQASATASGGFVWRRAIRRSAVSAPSASSSISCGCFRHSAPAPEMPAKQSRAMVSGLVLAQRLLCRTSVASAVLAGCCSTLFRARLKPREATVLLFSGPSGSPCASASALLKSHSESHGPGTWMRRQPADASSARE